MVELLHYIPAWLYGTLAWAVLLAGITALVLGYVVSSFTKLTPFFAYSTPLKIAGVLLTIMGVYLNGCYTTEMLWRNKVEELQVKLDDAEKKSQEVKTVVETKVVTKIKYIKVKAKKNVTTIRENAKELNSQCDLPDLAVQLHDRAARDEVPGSTGESTSQN